MGDGPCLQLWHVYRGDNVIEARASLWCLLMAGVHSTWCLSFSEESSNDRLLCSLFVGDASPDDDDDTFRKQSGSHTRPTGKSSQCVQAPRAQTAEGLRLGRWGRSHEAIARCKRAPPGSGSHFQRDAVHPGWAMDQGLACLTERFS